MMSKPSTVTSVTKRYQPINVTPRYRRYQALPPFRGWVTLVTVMRAIFCIGAIK